MILLSDAGKLVFDKIDIQLPK